MRRAQQGGAQAPAGAARRPARAMVLLLVLALVVVPLAVAPTASAWTGCRPHWDGESWEPVDVGGHTVWKPKTETMCY